MSIKMTRQPITTMNFASFAKAKGVSERTLRYRVFAGHINPMPIKDIDRWVFLPNAVIDIPTPKKPPGRPKGAKAIKRGYPRARTVKKKSK